MKKRTVRFLYKHRLFKLAYQIDPEMYYQCAFEKYAKCVYISV